jgi:DNA-binding HxlR family transcriptional regulator
VRSYDQYCGLAIALDVVGDRWTLLIVRELLTGAKRFRDLQNGLPGVATNLLSSRLRTLEERELVERRTLPPPAGSVAYHLTPFGAELAGPIHALIRWGGHFMGHRSSEQIFRPHWLGVALQALGVRSDSSIDPIAFQIVLPEGALLLELTREGVAFPTHGARQPDAWLRGPATTILGVAAGELDWRTAIRGGLRVEGSRTAVAVVRASLAQAGLANRQSRRITSGGTE